MLLEEGKSKNKRCKLIIAQPRRIAAFGLYQYMKKQLDGRFPVSLKMGNGTMEGDSDAQLTYITTGWLVKYLAHDGPMIGKCTHLIIDEGEFKNVVCILFSCSSSIPFSLSPFHYPTYFVIL